MTDKEPAGPGTGNAIAKVCAVFRSLTANEPQRLVDVSVATGLHRVTVLRILDSLVNEGFVERTGHPARYILGPEVIAMTAAAAVNLDLVAASKPSLLRLANQSEDTVLLSVRSGLEAVCIAKQLGSFPIRANYLEVGSRRPLGLGGGSMALLAWLPDDEIDAIFEIYSQKSEMHPALDEALLRDYIADAKMKGYVIMLDVIMEGIGAIAVPILNSFGQPVGALSIPALKDRLVSRKDELVAILANEAQIIAQAIERRTSRAKSARKSQ